MGDRPGYWVYDCHRIRAFQSYVTSSLPEGKELIRTVEAFSVAERTADGAELVPHLLLAPIITHREGI